MNTQIVLLALTSLAIGSTFSGCSKKQEAEKTRVQKASSCQGMVDILRFKTTTVAEIIDGQEGTYKLTDMRVYVETKDGEKLSYFAGRTTLAIDADPNPTPTPTPEVSPAPPAEVPKDAFVAENGKPAPVPVPEKPAEPVQVVTTNKIDCSDTTDIQESEIHGVTEAPIAISRKDGKIPETMNFKIKAEFQQNGEKTDAVEKSSTKAATEAVSKDASVSPLDEVAGSAAKRSFYKMNDSKSFAVRVEETQGTSKQVSILVYKLAPVKK